MNLAEIAVHLIVVDGFEMVLCLDGYAHLIAPGEVTDEEMERAGRALIFGDRLASRL